MARRGENPREKKEQSLSLKPEEIEVYEDMVRKEIVQKIEREMAKLQDLKHYFEHAYSKQAERDTFVFLFKVFNDLAKSEELSTSLGTHIADFEGPEEVSYQEGSVHSGYYWREGAFKRAGREQELAGGSSRSPQSVRGTRRSMEEGV
jgi:hypothetical protein